MGFLFPWDGVVLWPVGPSPLLCAVTAPLVELTDATSYCSLTAQDSSRCREPAMTRHCAQLDVGLDDYCAAAIKLGVPMGFAFCTLYEPVTAV